MSRLNQRSLSEEKVIPNDKLTFGKSFFLEDASFEHGGDFQLRVT